VRPASEAEKARLNDTFAALCRIPSPFGDERACADDVTARLRAMGLEVEEDAAAAEIDDLTGMPLRRA
jgi:tripeptide aminopeptidase